MMATMDTPMTNHDDLNLMGMQELDSTLSIFESSHHREASTATSSNYQFENSLEFTETLSHTIVVDSPGDHYTKMDRFGRAGQDIMFNESRSVADSTIFHIFIPDILKYEPQQSYFQQGLEGR